MEDDAREEIGQLHPNLPWKRRFGSGAQDEDADGRGPRAEAFDVHTGAIAGWVKNVAESLRKGR